MDLVKTIYEEARREGIKTAYKVLSEPEVGDLTSRVQCLDNRWRVFLTCRCKLAWRENLSIDSLEVLVGFESWSRLPKA